MMRYRTKITYVAGGKEYKPGAILPADISPADLRFLKSKGFAVVDAEAAETDDGTTDQEEEMDWLSGFQEQEPDALKSPEAIRKIRSKKEVFAYAGSIGLDLGENYEEKSLKELQEEIINFQEEQMSEEED